MTRQRIYLVIYEHTARNWAAYAPDVPGRIATSKTREEVGANFREAGLPIPEPTSDVGEVAIPA